MQRTGLRFALQLAAATVAAALALGRAGWRALEDVPSRDQIGAFERLLAPLRGALEGEARVAVLVNGEDIAPWYVAQYALAPATLVRRDAAACAGLRTREACAADAPYLLIPGAERAAAARFAEPLGFEPVAETAGTVLLARRSR